MLKGELLNEGVDPKELDIKINTFELYQKQFAFADVSKFDWSVETLNAVEAAQKNLNDNIDNEKLLDRFIDTSNEVAKKLQEKYPEGWSKPLFKEIS